MPSDQGPSLLSYLQSARASLLLSMDGHETGSLRRRRARPGWPACRSAGWGGAVGRWRQLVTNEVRASIYGFARAPIFTP